MSTKTDDMPPLPAPPTVSRWYLSPPPVPQPPLPQEDARTYALRAFGKWIGSLVFRRRMADGAPADPFVITKDRFFIEQPDNVENMQMPCIAVLPGRGQYETRSMGPVEPDDSLVGPDGTSLLVPWDYVETLTVEVWASKIPERRALVAGIELAIGLYEGSTDLRLVLTDYWGMVASFSLMEREIIDDVETPRGRRRAHFMIQLRVPVVGAARFAWLDPRPGGTVHVVLGDAGATVLPFGAAQAAQAASTKGAEAALRVLGLTEKEARTYAQGYAGVDALAAKAFTLDYVVATLLVMAEEAASLETWTGKPPYSPGETRANAVQRMLVALRGPIRVQPEPSGVGT